MFPQNYKWQKGKLANNIKSKQEHYQRTSNNVPRLRNLLTEDFQIFKLRYFMLHILFKTQKKRKEQVTTLNKANITPGSKIGQRNYF